MDHSDELLQHLLSDGKVSDHAVFHRADCLDIAGHFAQHGLGFSTNGLNIFFRIRPALLANRDNRRLIEHNAEATHINQSIGGTQVNCQIIRKITTQKSKHESCPYAPD